MQQTHYDSYIHLIHSHRTQTKNKIYKIEQKRTKKINQLNSAYQLCHRRPCHRLINPTTIDEPNKIYTSKLKSIAHLLIFRTKIKNKIVSTKCQTYQPNRLDTKYVCVCVNRILFPNQKVEKTHFLFYFWVSVKLKQVPRPYLNYHTILDFIFFFI